MAEATRQRLLDVYQLLLEAYGFQGWWPVGESIPGARTAAHSPRPGEQAPFVVIVGAILTQSTAWANVERALDNLRVAGLLSPEALLRVPEGDLAVAVRSSGYFQVKARKLKAFVAMLFERFGGDVDRLLALPVDELRATLLATYGIGPETADDIILYAARKPVFVIDAYTRRVFARLGITPAVDTYDAWQSLFMDALPSDVPLFNEYHALIVRQGKMTCRKEPLCERCALLSICPTGQARLRG